MFLRPVLLTWCAVTFSSLGSAQTTSATAFADTDLKLNQIQVIGTHNSYHAGLPTNEKLWLQKENPQAAAALDYSHPPLTQQFDAGVRQIELDVYADTKGGLYAHPKAPSMVAAAGLPLIRNSTPTA